jgi:hypothetical protein
MTALDPLDQALELARATLAPSSDDDARLRRALGLGPVGVIPPPAPPRASASLPRVLDARAWRALRASGSAGALVGAVLMGFGFGAGFWLGRADERPASPPMGLAPASVERVDTSAADTAAGDRTAPPSDPAPHDDTAPRDDTAEPEPSPPPSEPIVRRPARASRPPPSRAHVASSSAGEELALLRRVERALRAQNPALALALIAELDQRFPDTRLAEEREAAHVIAACGIGEGGARLRAERFLREQGGSVYAERAREACGIREASPRGEGSAPPGDQ